MLDEDLAFEVGDGDVLVVGDDQDVLVAASSGDLVGDAVEEDGAEEYGADTSSASVLACPAAARSRSLAGGDALE